MKLIIQKNGAVGGIYSETIDLSAFGAPEIRRASHLEPDEAGQWTANLAPVNGPVLGPVKVRSDALKAEHEYIDEHLPSIMSRR
jgi:hypothetical protein